MTSTTSSAGTSPASLFSPIPARLIDAVSQAVEEHTGHAPELSTGGGTSDGRFISPAGVDVVELGPVSASIHKIDEHVRLEDACYAHIRCTSVSSSCSWGAAASRA